MQIEKYPVNLEIDFDIFGKDGGAVFGGLNITISLSNNYYPVEDIRTALQEAFEVILTHY
ncbi:hypothetical protein [Maledivibacter halophilus]|uniref:Uncharacterized protein n=1 Tax=Maledivibacter halophilus TaxID=36842 RepID=A0A1T5KDU0_9FIRM|nr:hypothetical protein [Maledivibacter halophilus]SKC61851.1 hypothetical protein SAMN02194393_01718 [Maledivibacter halophilus]